MSDRSKGTTAKNAEPVAEPTTPKSKLSWAEKMAQLPPEEAAAARAKAAAASRISKAKARGTTPCIAAAMRLKAQLAKNIEKTELLAIDRAHIETKLAEIEAQLAEETDDAGDE